MYRAQYFLGELIVSPEQFIDFKERLDKVAPHLHTHVTYEWLLDLGLDPKLFEYKNTRVRVDWEVGIKK